MSWSSPMNNTLTELDGTVVYKVATPFTFGGSTTTITRNGEALATINWSAFESSELTMGGMTAPISKVFPRAGNLSDSRIFTAPNGEKLKWNVSPKLHCVFADNNLPLATYCYKRFGAVRGKRSTLDISPEAAHLMDVLVVTWLISEKNAQDRRSAISAVLWTSTAGEANLAAAAVPHS